MFGTFLIMRQETFYTDNDSKLQTLRGEIDQQPFPDQRWQLLTKSFGFRIPFWLTGWISHPCSCNHATFIYPQRKTDYWGILCCLSLMHSLLVNRRDGRCETASPEKRLKKTHTKRRLDGLEQNQSIRLYIQSRYLGHRILLSCTFSPNSSLDLLLCFYV